MDKTQGQSSDSWPQDNSTSEAGAPSSGFERQAGRLAATRDPRAAGMARGWNEAGEGLAVRC